MKTNSLKWLAYLSCIGMFLVLLAGALVTKTGSGRGCGDDFPLCNGKFIPAYTVESIIEYSHRAVTGVVGLVILATAIAIPRYLKQRKDAKWYAIGALFFTIVQAILGAMAVMFAQSSAVKALHFGISLMAFACTLLLAVLMRRLSQGKADNVPTAGRSVSKGFRNAVWIVGIYCYIVVYIGAFVRHTESSGGCVGWPLCNGQVIPELSGATLIAFTHRIAAFVLFIVIAAVAFVASRKYNHIRELYSASLWALALVVLQVFSGGFVTVTFGSEDWQLFSSMLHTAIISVLFSVLSYLCIRAWQLSR